MKLIASCGVKMTIAFNYLIICMHLPLCSLLTRIISMKKTSKKNLKLCQKNSLKNPLPTPPGLVFIIIMYKNVSSLLVVHNNSIISRQRKHEHLKTITPKPESRVVERQWKLLAEKKCFENFPMYIFVERLISEK